jgi:Fe-S oxidoreductase
MTAAYTEVKRTFDPKGIMNPGKIVAPPRMDDRSLFRYRPGYAARTLPVALDWSATGGLLGAVERCNNNGACRKYEPDVMCPSFRVTHDERHSTRGRANALRLALTDQLGPDGLDSPEMAEAMSLCISCKGCRRECPTGVDMARMKLEWQHRRNRERGVPLRERVLASLPRVAPRASALGALLDLGARTPAPRLLGLSAKRALPRWSRHPWRADELAVVKEPDVVLFVDTFTRWFEPEIARSAARVLRAGGSAVASLEPRDARPYCCGRTYLSAGMLDEALFEATRLVDALATHARHGAAIVGLEPSCLYTLRDEIPALVQSEAADVVAERAVMLEEHLDAEWARGHELPFAAQPADDAPPARRALVHGHCHQKAFGGTAPLLRMLGRVPGLDPAAIESSCCGMAGAFGYHSEHHDVSMRMGELTLFPAVRAATTDTLLVADGTSCRAQIADGTERRAVHSAVVLDAALGEAQATP